MPPAIWLQRPSINKLARRIISSAARRVNVKSKNRARVDALIDQMSHAINQSAGFTGAGAGNDQQRSFDRGRCLILRVIQFFAVIESGTRAGR